MVNDASEPPKVTLFDDQTSNITWITNSKQKAGSNIGVITERGQYFEGNNFYIYIHGKDDPEGEWWNTDSEYKKSHSKGGVLVNCHFDS